jgi:hypothetical protein
MSEGECTCSDLSPRACDACVRAGEAAEVVTVRVPSVLFDAWREAKRERDEYLARDRATYFDIGPYDRAVTASIIAISDAVLAQVKP